MKTAQSNVLILGHEEDPHLPFVTKHLRNQPRVINMGRIPEGTGLTYRTGPRSADPQIIYGGELLVPSQIEGVWYRSLDIDKLSTTDPRQRVITDFDNQRAVQEYALSSMNQLAGAMAELLPDALWVSSRQALRRADIKALQVSVAQQVGFNIPDTLFTSDEYQASAFLPCGSL